MRRPVEQPRIFLNKGEALTFAAEQLEAIANSCGLAELIIVQLQKRQDENSPATEALHDLKRRVPEPAIQAAALRSAAAAIRELAMEERLVAARAQAAENAWPRKASS